MKGQFKLKKSRIFNEKKRPILIAGPCSAESKEQVLETAVQLANIGCRIYRAGVWKPRTKPGGFEGYGEVALSWLEEVKKEVDMLVAVEVATPNHVELALKHGVDVLWIGSRTTTNPFAVQSLSDALRGVDIPVLVKNPMCPDLSLWLGAMERLNKVGVRKIAAIHRGFSVYGDEIYRNAPIWSIPIELRRLVPDLSIICDPSHMGGKRDLIAQLSQQAMDLCYDGLMVESHYNPDVALTDANQQVTPTSLGKILEKLIIRNDKHERNELFEYRKRIDELDEIMIGLLSNRIKICRKVANYKATHGLTVLQTKRYDELMEKWIDWGEVYGLPTDFSQHIFRLIHEESINEQVKILNNKCQV